MIPHLEDPCMNRSVSSLIACVAFALVVSNAFGDDFPFVPDVAKRINAERAKKGLTRLKYNETLAKAAQSQAEWMAQQQKMEHLRPAPKSLEEHKTCNEHPANRIINAGYFTWDDLFVVETRADGHVVNPRPDTDSRVGEIIAKGANAGHPATQPPQIVPGWMNSPGHRKTILTPQFEEFGIGCACIENDTYWCVVFAKPMR
jgi:uncharacterized protein YkwD